MSVVQEIKEQAEKELKEEQRRHDVDSYKNKLKAKKWWHKLLPFKIVLIRRE